MYESEHSDESNSGKTESQWLHKLMNVNRYDFVLATSNNRQTEIFKTTSLN